MCIGVCQFWDNNLHQLNEEGRIHSNNMVKHIRPAGKTRYTLAIGLKNRWRLGMSVGFI